MTLDAARIDEFELEIAAIAAATVTATTPAVPNMVIAATSDTGTSEPPNSSYGTTPVLMSMIAAYRSVTETTDSTMLSGMSFPGRSI